MKSDRYDVRIVCGCGNYLGHMKQADGSWINVDPRQQPRPPRMELDERDRWQGRCTKCRAKPLVQRERFERALAAVKAAGLTQMPLRGI